MSQIPRGQAPGRTSFCRDCAMVCEVIRRAFAQKRKGVSVVVVKNSRNRLLHAVDVAQFNAQYANSLTVKTSDMFHDRFLIIDKMTLIHVGASLNHLGKKCFRRR